MARIPLGNPASVVATPAPQVQTTPNDFGAANARAEQGEGAALTQAGDDIVRQQHKLNDDLQRTSAAVAYQQHATNMQLAVKQAGTDLSSGKIDQTGYQQALADAKQNSYDSTIGALPSSHYKNVANIQSGALDRMIAIDSQDALTKNTQQQIAANASSLLDTAGKNIVIAPATIDSTVSSTKSAYLSAAAAAGIPKPQAEKTAQDWANQQYAQHALSAAISARSTGDLATLTKLERDLTAPDGFYANKMDANQRNQVLSNVVSQRLTLENQMDAQQQARENQAVQAYNQGLDLMNAGHLFSPAYAKQLTDATTGTSLAADTQKMIATASQNAGFASLPVAQMRAAIHRDQTAANTPGVGTDPATAAAVKQRQTTYTAAVEAYKQDPWNAALNRGVITQIPPIDASSIPNLVTSLQQRAQSAGVVDAAAGRNVSLLTPDEATQVLNTVSALDTDSKAQMLSGIGNAFGSAARINDLAEQWKEKKPAIALALKAGSGGGDGSPLMTTKGLPVGSFILAGQQALDDKTVKIDDAVGTGMKAQIANAINGTLPPMQADDAKEGAYYIAIANAQKNGRQVPSASDVQAAVDTATGGISNTGGQKLDGTANKVARPYGWDDDAFQASVKTASTNDIENRINGKPIDTVYANGHPLPVDDFMSKFPSYQLVRVGVRGTYAVQTGSKFVTDKAGKPVTVHLTYGQKTPSGVPSATQSGVVDNPFSPQM